LLGLTRQSTPQRLPQDAMAFMPGSSPGVTPGEPRRQS
jgi:hypothetical protein